MIIPSGAISRSLKRLVAQIAPFASGGGVGWRARTWMICHGRERRGVFPPEVRAQATAIACSLPKEADTPLARWSVREIAKRLEASTVVTSIAASTIARWLQVEKIKPWRYHSWQHILDPQVFLARARPVLQLYTQAKTLLSEGEWVVCVDEKTSIQAREMTSTPQPAQAERPMQTAARYVRHGAVQLFAALSVADGRVYGSCRERKRFVDFQSFILNVLVPEAQKRGVRTVAMILDNGSTHAPKRLEVWLHEQQVIHQWPFQFQVYWLPTNASWLDQIEIWFSILQRKLLQPNHFQSLVELKQTISDFIQHYNQTARPIRWSYTVEKLEQKLGNH
jgi:transposase